MKNFLKVFSSSTILGLSLFLVAGHSSGVSSSSKFKVMGDAEFALNKSSDQVIETSQFKVAENAFFG